VKNRYPNLPFKFNLQRYTAAAWGWGEARAVMRAAPTTLLAMVGGLYKFARI
jgi:hypothetical protein